MPGLKILGLKTLAVCHQNVSGCIDSIRAIGEACGESQLGNEVADRMQSRLDWLRRKTADCTRPRVMFCIERTKIPGRLADVYIAGRDDYYSEMIACAGGENVYSRGLVRYPTMSPEGILHLNPDVIVDLVDGLNQKSGDSNAADASQSTIADWRQLGGQGTSGLLFRPFRHRAGHEDHQNYRRPRPFVASGDFLGQTMNQDAAEIVLEAKNFSLARGGKEILRDVSFQVRRGEYVTIVGPNGAGKTTLLKSFDRLIEGGSGELEICGVPREKYHQRELARQIAYVPQADGRTIPFTVEQFLLMCRYPYLSPFAAVGKEDRRLVREAMARTETVQFADRLLTTLSGGERQKVYIAAALAQGAPIWLLDEPTTFLDYGRQAEILSLLAAANRKFGATIVSVTHDLNHAVLETDRVIALKEGCVAFNGPPAEIMKSEVLREIFGASLLLVDHPQSHVPMIVPRVSTEALS
jgi:iron complex transport system ATP-binding protein